MKDAAGKMFYTVASAKQLTSKLKILHSNEKTVCMSFVASFPLTNKWINMASPWLRFMKLPSPCS